MIERHQLIATLIFLAVSAVIGLREGVEPMLRQGTVLLALLLPILFYRLLAWLSSFGFPEYFARDFGSENHPGPYAVFFWLVFLGFAAYFLLLPG